MSPTSSVLLQVDSSPRPESASRALTAAYADAWQEANPDGRVLHHDLPVLDLPHLNSTEMGAWFDDPADHTHLHQLVLARSDGLIEDVLAADEILIGAPMWNFSIPSSLKAWIDHIVRHGRTIHFTPDGAVGGLTATRAIVVSFRGADYRVGGPMAAMDLQEPYLRQILGFLGVHDVSVVHVDHQGPTWPDSKEVFDEAKEQLLGLVTA